jgi:hypothetical protein
MAAGGLIYAVITVAVLPGVVHRFRSAGQSNHDVDEHVAVLWLGAAVALVVAVLLFALYVVLGVALRRGSNGARIGTLVISVLGALGGIVAAVTVLIERSGDGSADSLGGRLSGAYPDGWIGTNAGLAVAQVLAYVIVLILVLRAPRGFFGGGPGMPGGAHGQMPPIYGGSFPPGHPGAQPGYAAPQPGPGSQSGYPTAQPGYPAPGQMGQPGYPGVGQPGYPMPAQGQPGYPGSAPGQPFYAPPGYAAPGPGQAGYPGQFGYAAPNASQPGYAGAGADQSGYAAPNAGRPDSATPGQPGDAPTYPGQPGYPGGQPAQPSEYAAPGTPGQPDTPAGVSPSSDTRAPRESDSGHRNAAPNATETASPEAVERPSESAGASYHGASGADNGPRAGDDAAPGAIPSEAPPAPAKPPASADEYWKRPAD